MYAMFHAAYDVGSIFPCMRYWLRFHCCVDDIDGNKEFHNDSLEVRRSEVSVPDGVDAGNGLWAKKNVKKGFLLAFPGFWVHRCDVATLQESDFYSFDLPFEASEEVPTQRTS